MDNEQIKETIGHFKALGRNIRVRDIAYTLLSKMFADPKTAYQCLFDGDIEGFDKYSGDPIRESVEDFLTEQGFIKNLSTDDNTGGITFEQNKQAMEQMLKDVQADMDAGIIDRKDGYARMESIRKALNDKFKIERQQQERVIVVEKKFNSVCEFCHHEIYVPTVEDLKEMYNLTEKK